MIIPTLKIEHHKVDGFDLHGQAKLRRLPDVMVCPVRLVFDQQHTTVRTDSAASHGAAMEMTATCVLLAKPKTTIRIEDMLVVMGNKIRVIEKHPRYTVTGHLDHWQIKATAWG